MKQDVTKSMDKSTSIDYQKDLNPAQFAAVSCGKGPALVLAGAGSGKTRVLIYRVAYLVDQGIDPGRVLLVTFTQKAAKEMLTRVDTLLGQEVRNIWGGTFHHIGNILIRRYARYVGYKPDFTIMDREDSKDMMAECVRECGIDPKATKFPKADILVQILSFSRSCRMAVKQAVFDKYAFLVDKLPQVEDVIKTFSNKKIEQNLMDFDDLLVYWNKLLDIPEVREQLSKKFEYILVDEYQDTNRLQAGIMDKMASYHKNLMVVGDDAQSIYSFRGAEYKNIRDFSTRYTDAKVFKLETNYRSTPQVLSFANEIVKHTDSRFRKQLVSIKNSGVLPVVVSIEDTRQQAAFVCQRVLQLRDEGVPLRDMAVLYRAHFHSMELELELMRRRIPYVVRSGIRYFERAHIKDVLAHLKFVRNPHDELSFKRAIKLLAGIGTIGAHKAWKQISSTSNALKACQQKAAAQCIPRAATESWQQFAHLLKELDPHSSPAAMIQTVLEEGYAEYLQYTFADYRDRQSDVAQLAEYAEQYSSLNQFLAEISLREPVTAQGTVLGSEVTTDTTDVLTMSTVHRAKGLEWDTVFVISVSEGYFPISKAYGDTEQYEEERRLFYVATTRAKSHLILSYPSMATRGGQSSVVIRPSRFLTEIDQCVYQKWNSTKSRYGRRY
jgi:DNA helicase-2/ATP-dependent DNA helicase PcrA